MADPTRKATIYDWAEKTQGLMQPIIKLSQKVLPFVYAAGGKLEWDLVQANTPLVRGSLTLKLETPIANRLIDAIMTRWRKKPQEDILGNDDDDDWLLISEMDFESELETFVELTQEFEGMIAQEGNGTGGNNSDPIIIEHYMEMILGKSTKDADGERAEDVQVESASEVEPAQESEQTDTKRSIKLTMERIIKQGRKLLLIVYAAGGKFEWDLVEAQSPLLKGSLTLKLEMPLAAMLIDAMKKQKPQDAIQDAITGKDDDWLLISKLDPQSELTPKFDEAQEGNRTGGYSSHPFVIEQYVELMLGKPDLGKKEAAHQVQPWEEFEPAVKSESTNMKRDDVVLLISDLDLQGGISTCAENFVAPGEETDWMLVHNADPQWGISKPLDKDYLIQAENEDDVGVQSLQTVKEEEVGAGKPEEGHAAAL